MREKRSLGVRAHLLRLWRRLVKQISAEACSGKEIAGLLKKKMMKMMMMMIMMMMMRNTSGKFISMK